ncbi:hypothetical protein QWY85_18660 [Neolewinella lacunae]|uniref:Uncharacterized protein n=1 Tax=Neolewinella lacunae TaxID=1517758 RepID=A0A923PIX9_9BACT|nr:hypothetical protein [Neolewinella lacunae]MBC6994154.1 hypothetical protein [Neolewinella lacunae]MDN3636697.1 hypothetical protein [Neolewinella lacunae]
MKEGTPRILHHNLDYQPVHLSYRLAGSLPVAVLDKIKSDYEQRKAQLTIRSNEHRAQPPSKDYAREIFALHARFELEIDEALHSIKSGPFHLADPSLAKEIIDS